jgi:hypothetical protein
MRRQVHSCRRADFFPPILFRESSATATPAREAGGILDPEDLMTDAPFAASPGMVEQLRRTRRWVLLLACAGFIASAFIAVMPLAMLISARTVGWQEILFVSFPTALYLPLVLVPAAILYRFGAAISAVAEDPQAIERALRLQRFFFMSLGIILLVMVVATAAGVAAAFLLP